MSLTTTERRRQLCNLLRAAGYKVRMHSFQYFIRGDKFVCILTLHPHWQTAKIHRINWNRDESVRAVRDVARLVKTLAPELAVEIV